MCPPVDPAIQSPEIIASPVVQLRAAGVALVVALPPSSLPVILHWGHDPGELSEQELLSLLSPAVPPAAANQAGLPEQVSVLPEGQSRWTGTPGIVGHREGRSWSPKFITKESSHIKDDDQGGTISIVGVDADARLGLNLHLELLPTGILRSKAELTNLGDDIYTLDSLALALPVPGRADLLIDFAGRWSKERTIQTRAFTVGTHLREGRHGRTGADAATLLMAATANVDFDSGEVWGMHVAFSGNHRVLAEQVLFGQRHLMGGELLLPGEIRLDPGDSYSSPSIFGVYGKGLDGAANQIHSYLRGRPPHPSSPRPVVLNVWEAVYFDHDLTKLLELADLASGVGVERFVLDDGWFGSRRDDTSGLGDWELSEEVWGQDRFRELVEGVRARGMEFGLWFEPEMVNMDSDLARAHPEWVMQVEGRLPVEVRNQQVLDLSHPGAYQHVHDQMARLINEYNIDFIKWDHNRDLVDAGSTRTGRAGVHEQTLATYRLMDALREEFPGLEIESCSSGGARVDLEVLERTDRVWASDCIDPEERQQIQRWTAQLLPPELVGSHVGDGRAHTTSRLSDLEVRAATALFGHFGIEWDLTKASADEIDQLATWIAYYKAMRQLIHTGTMVRRDLDGGNAWLQGAVAADGSQALYGITQRQRPSTWPTNRVQLPGLDRGALYAVAPSAPTAISPATIQLPPLWWGEGLVLSGAALADIGVFAPALHPDRTVFIHVTKLGDQD